MVSEMDRPCGLCGHARRLHDNLFEGQYITPYSGACASMGCRCDHYEAEPVAGQQPAPALASRPEDGGWVGVDLDGVLVEWDPKYLPGLGPPIPSGIALVYRLLNEGREIRIFTARVQANQDEPAWRAEAQRLIGTSDALLWVRDQRDRIDVFCREHFGAPLRITAAKDWKMITCYDDRCVQMVPNTGRSLEEIHQAQLRKIAELIGDPDPDQG